MVLMRRPAIGAGLCLAAACDIRIAAASARLGWTFATLGLHPGMAATHFTAQLVGVQMAAKLLLTGEVTPAPLHVPQSLDVKTCPRS